MPLEAGPAPFSALDVPIPAPDFGWQVTATHGAKCDARSVGDVVTTAGSPIITSATAVFLTAHAGKVASLRVGANGLTTTIASVQSATQATLAANAPATRTDGILTFGTDDTAAIQRAIDACPPAGTVYHSGQSLITARLSITKSLTIRTSGHGKVMGGVVDSGYGSGASIVPYIEGACFIQAGPGANGIDITGTGAVVHLHDVAIRFAPAIMFTDTGHGIFCQATAMFNTGHENGPMNCRWDTITVWGHDGNHYAYWFMSGGHLSTFTHLQSQGGGGLYFGSDGDGTAGYGNSHFDHCFWEVITGGTAHGVHIDGRMVVNNPTYGSSVNLITFVRPQCNIGIVPYVKLDNNKADGGKYGIPQPLATQYLWLHTGGSYAAKKVDIIAPDLEPGFGNPVDFGGIHNGATVRKTGTMPAPVGGVSTEDRANPIYSGVTGTNKPTLTLLSGAGTGATAQWVHGHQLGGLLQINLGPDPLANTDMIRVTCDVLPATGLASVFVQPASPWGQTNKTVFVKDVGVNSKSFVIRCLEGYSASAIVQMWVVVMPAYAFMGEQV